VSFLKVPEKTNGSFQVTLGHQSKEDQAVNGTSDKIPWKSDGWRYPLVLLLDGIVRIFHTLLKSMHESFS
jgi:21S rRNA (GM2251-2'-O)-methyltransferase